MDLLSYWNLRERPFETTWDTRFFFQSRDHDEALERLAFLVEEQTMLFGMLTGEIGCGKTLTRAVFTERLEARKFRVVTQENSAFRFNDLIGSVLQNLEDNTNHARTKFARYERLRQAMESQGFKFIPAEWWHFDYKDWNQYPILNVKFEDLGN